MLPLFIIRKKLLANRARLGSWGERFCERYLKHKGYQCIARNFSVNSGEIDLVMTEGKSLVFVEVKTRASEEFEKAQEAVDGGKQRRIASAAKFFIKKYKLADFSYRFDVVAVILPKKGNPEIRHYQKAFSG